MYRERERCMHIYIYIYIYIYISGRLGPASRAAPRGPGGVLGEKGLRGLSQNNNFREHSRRKLHITKLGVLGGAKVSGSFGLTPSEVSHVNISPRYKAYERGIPRPNADPDVGEEGDVAARRSAPAKRVLFQQYSPNLSKMVFSGGGASRRFFPLSEVGTD